MRKYSGFLEICSSHQTNVSFAPVVNLLFFALYDDGHWFNHITVLEKDLVLFFAHSFGQISWPLLSRVNNSCLRNIIFSEQ